MKRRFWYWITDALAVLALLGITVYLLIRWPSLPARLPSGFGVRGEITDWGSKAGSLTTLLVVSWIMFASLFVLSFFPQSWNIPRRTPRAYQATGNAMAVLRFLLSLIFSYVLACTSRCVDIGIWFLPLLIAVIVGNLVYILIQSFRR